MHFEHERRLEVKEGFEHLDKIIDEVKKTVNLAEFDIRELKQKYDFMHKEKNEKNNEFLEDIKKIQLQINGDGNGTEGLIRKMDTLKSIPALIRSNTNTMRWTIGIMVTANLGMFAAIISIAKHR